MKIVGLDLSITATGVADRDGHTLTIRASAIGGDRRLVTIRDQVSVITHDCDLVVIEDLPTHAHGSGITGMVHGAVRSVLLGRGIPYVLVTPASVKKFATGKGNATKPDMRMSLFKRADLDLRDDNQVDAWWLRAMALDHYGLPMVQMPATHRAALAKVAWPKLVGD